VSQLSSEQEVGDLFRASVPPDLLREVTGIILHHYAEAHEQAALLARAPFNREIRPWVRRARIHEDLQRLADIYPGLTAEIIEPGGNTVTVALAIGDVRILVARAISPHMMIRLSNYRLNIAIQSLQGNLFGETPVSADAKLYGVILHGGDQGGPAPAFVAVRFPTADHATYLDVQIDLLTDYMTANAGLTGVEEVVPTRTLTLKPGAKWEGDSA
jgi:hypothetical protein